MEDDKYRENVGIMVMNAEKLILLCERKDVPGAWQMPQGGIEPGEDVVSAGLRELFEETSIKAEKKDVIAETKEWLFYDFPPGNQNIRKYGFKGQKQKWILVRFLGDFADINLANEEEEFVSWKWACAEEVIQSIVPFKRGIYEQVIKEFSDFLR